jgi:alanine dehydrogenase
MDFGVPLEKHHAEHRIGLTPQGARVLADLGHRVFVESGAGEASRFPDAAYRESGAEVVFRREEVFLRSQIIVSVSAPTPEEIAITEEEQTLLAFWHVAVAQKALLAAMQKKRLTAIGYELIEESNQHRPVLHAMSELAGQMAIHTAAHLLQRESGGRGVLLGSSPGIPPSTILILGAGTVGRSAARVALSLGAHVIVFDENIEKLHVLTDSFGGNLTTSTADRESISRFLPFADVVIGAVLRPGGRAPYLVTKDMVEAMRPGAVILDLSIDQGGCIETSRPTSLDEPTFVYSNVVHYCVGNMTADIPRTASKALTQAHVRYLEKIGAQGIEGALRDSLPLQKGAFMYRGTITQESMASAFGFEYRPVQSLLGGEGRR